MAGDGVQLENEKKKAKRRERPTSSAPDGDNSLTIRCSRSGEWLPTEELRAAVLDATHRSSHVTLDLAGVEHLDAATLQVLLALANNRREKGLPLHLVNASPLLSQWLTYAGASAHLSETSSRKP